MGKERLANFYAVKKAYMRSGHHLSVLLAVVTLSVSVRVGSGSSGDCR